MRGIATLARTALVLAGLLLLVQGAEATVRVQDTYHNDHRTTPRLQFDPAWSAPGGTEGPALAHAYLAARAADYELPGDLANLELVRVQESLLGTHYTFGQRLGAYEVENAAITVSIAKADGRVYRVYNNTFPVKTAPAAESPLVDTETSFDIAWEALRAHGGLLAAPSSRALYVPRDDQFVLETVVDLALDAPFGYWRVRIDAVTGRVLSIEDTALPRMKTADAGVPAELRVLSYLGPIGDRRAAFREYQDRASAEQRPAPRTFVNGSGTVFDPDPRTTLQSETIQDTSPAGTFTPAYFTRALLDITLNAGTYSLTGPWVTISNFETPNTAPSTTTTGIWTAVRGNNAFNDALTYFHLDQSQRYMQSLGFVGGTGIQYGSIFTDTDGLSGADNSHYVPGTNRLAFGHGCVDDSEDADVVLHEYGHAIQFSINSGWSGGDTGAIGEGFGDYWAGSYSYSAQNGTTFHPEWVFSWDGHGVPASCWDGRILNAFGAQYDPNATYGAHQSIPGGYQSDELWSTPLFQTLITLIGQGHPRAEVDQIILESHFGLGGGVSMRDMANATIATASLLQPGGPHADVFTQKFLVHNIVDVPAVVLESAGVAVSQAGGNGVPDPGETVHATIWLHNAGTLEATDVSATLTTGTAGVTIDQGASIYNNIGIGGTEGNLTDYVLSIDPGVACGTVIDLSLDIQYGAGSSVVLPIDLQTGEVVGVSQHVSPNLAIPDNNTTGISSTIVVSGTGASVTSSFNVDIDITHTYIGDLKVSLQSPQGTTVVLHNRTGGSADNLVGNYPGTLTPSQPLSAFFGQALDGNWKLTVQDLASIDTGTLNMWGINDVQGYQCESAADAPSAGATYRFALQPALPNPAASDVAIRFSLAKDGTAVRLEVVDVAGRLVRTLAQGTLGRGEHTRVWDRKDDAGRAVGAGVYFYRLRQGREETARKLLVIG